MSPRKRRVDRLFDAVADGDALPAGRIDDPDDAAALRVAIELRAARPAADLPSETFVAKLRHQLAEERREVPAGRAVSRRSLLAGAGAIAAGAVAAAAAGVAIDRTLIEPATPAGGAQAEAQLDPTDGQWTAVATQAELTVGTARRFDTPGVVGFVSATDNGVVAVSAACSHLGCILQQNAPSGRLDCPCHRTAFGYDGKVMFSQLETTPPPLTRIQVRQRDGSVEVFVPKLV